jgi:mono/diheme cytochrome c family protein
MRSLLVALVFMAGCAQVGMDGPPETRPTPPPIPPQAWRLTQGEALYFRHCADCHGWQGQGDGSVGRMLGLEVPNLRRAELYADRSEDELLASVVSSGPLAAPLDTTRLTPTEQDLDAIAAYLRRLPNIPWEQIGKGQQLYDTFCISCHGLYGRGDGLVAARLPTFPRDLSAPDYQRQVSDAELLRIIADGRGLMPGVKNLMTAEQVQSVISYLRLLSPGHELYSRFCATCHGADGQPTATDPDAAWEKPRVVFNQSYFEAQSAASVRRGIGHLLQQSQAVMPHVNGGLSQDEIRQILSYLRQLPKEPGRPS